jgi:hypothetical protein
MVRAELHPVDDGTGGEVVVSNAVGPIEGGPPRARTIWVEGAPCVGGLLLGRWMYFGGHQGKTEVSWVRVGSDGASVVVKGPGRVDRGVGDPPALGSTADAAGDGHPCAYRLGPDDEGCVIKFRVHPFRADGDEGHAEAARLPAKIGAAPADDAALAAVEKEAASRAPTVVSARAWTDDSRTPPPGEGSPTTWPGGVALGGSDWIKAALAAAAALE